MFKFNTVINFYSRIQINYDKEIGKTVNNSKTEDTTVRPETEIDHAFTDELLQKIEILTKDKSELAQELEEAKTNEISAKKQLEASRQTNLIGNIFRPIL